MRKKPDILLLLVVLVVSGVVISNFVVFKQGSKISNMSLLKAYSPEPQPAHSPGFQADIQADKSAGRQFSSHDVVHIDSLKKQIH